MAGLHFFIVVGFVVAASGQPPNCGVPNYQWSNSAPNVLVIGDTIAYNSPPPNAICCGYVPVVQNLFGNNANIQVIPVQGGSSQLGVSCLDTWLDGRHWDAITFNFGLHDIEGDQQHVPIDQYQDNIGNITHKLMSKVKSESALIWVDTTPVPSGQTLSPPRNENDVIYYNYFANQVTSSGGVVTFVPLWKTMTQACGGSFYQSCPEYQLPDDVHFNEAGWQLLGKAVHTTLRQVLNHK